MASLPMFPAAESGSSRLVGIARLATLGESVDSGHNVEFKTIPVRSLLTKCVSKRRMPFHWTINPYRGCEFACKYCFARYAHEFMELEPLDFERKIYVKQQAAWLLRQDLRRVKPGQSIALGTATDPYQPAERRHGITRSVLEEFSLHSGLEIGIVTKSNLVLRDLDVLQKVAKANSLMVHITVTTLDNELARILEPRVPRPDLRLKAVRMLNENGIPTGVLCCPVVPGITDDAKNLERVLKAAAQHKAQAVHANPLYLKPATRAVFMPFLEEKFPHLAKVYHERYKDGAYLPKQYYSRIRELMDTLRKKHGIATTVDDVRTRFMHPRPDFPGGQLELFSGSTRVA